MINVSWIRVFFTKGHERSVKAKKNILGSFVFKGGSILISLLLVPLTLHYLNSTRYGIWLTLTSIVGWFSFFDIGLGNGLRNKFAEAIAKNNKVLARKYVSTAYAIITIIAALLFMLFFFINPLIDWTKVLNAPENLKNELDLLAILVFGFFCLRFIFQLINTILTADQKPAISTLTNFTINLISLGVLYLLTITTSGSLIYLGLTLGISPLVLIIVSVLFFNKEYREYKPSLKYIDFNQARPLISLGIQFFIIQISAIVLFTTDNIIISQLFGPAQVTPYYVAYKYFGVIILIFTIINTPFWSAYTEAYHKKDIRWIKNINAKLKKTWAVLSGLAIVLLLISPFAYQIWVGSEVQVPYILSAFMCIYVIEQSWGNIFVSFINGVGKVRMQLIISVVTGVLNIPLSIFFAKYLGLGIAGIILATIICISYSPFLAWVQYEKIINNTARGIWNK